MRKHSEACPRLPRDQQLQLGDWNHEREVKKAERDAAKKLAKQGATEGTSNSHSASGNAHTTGRSPTPSDEDEDDDDDGQDLNARKKAKRPRMSTSHDPSTMGGPIPSTSAIAPVSSAPIGNMTPSSNAGMPSNLQSFEVAMGGSTFR